MHWAAHQEAREFFAWRHYPGKPLSITEFHVRHRVGWLAIGKNLDVYRRWHFTSDMQDTARLPILFVEAFSGEDDRWPRAVEERWALFRFEDTFFLIHEDQEIISGVD